jgi:hypothetical protein
MAFSLQRSSAPLGAEIKGVDLAREVSLENGEPRGDTTFSSMERTTLTGSTVLAA